MRDLNLNEFANEIRDELLSNGVDLSKSLVYQMTKAFFKHAEKVAKSGDSRFIIYQRDLTQVYPRWNVKELCAELAEGKDVLTADRLIQINKMEKRVMRHYKKMRLTADISL